MIEGERIIGGDALVAVQNDGDVSFLGQILGKDIVEVEKNETRRVFLQNPRRRLLQ